LPEIKAEEIPFEIPNNWTWCRLGEVCLKITDGFHNTPPKISKGFPYISATHVKSDKIDWNNCHFVAEQYHRELWNKTYPSLEAY
jgi:type I restriction enzyme S subunit